MKHDAHEVAPEMTISVRFGSIITAILKACQVDLSGHTSMSTLARVDILSLQHSHFRRGWVQDTYQFFYLFPAPGGKTEFILLPSTYLPLLSSGSPTFAPTPETYFRPTIERSCCTLTTYFKEKHRQQTVQVDSAIPDEADDTSEASAEEQKHVLETLAETQDHL